MAKTTVHDGASNAADEQQPVEVEQVDETDVEQADEKPTRKRARR